MDALMYLPNTCSDVRDNHVCVAAHGHVEAGLSHICACGTEWLDAGIGGTYHPNPAREMAQAS